MKLRLAAPALALLLTLGLSAGVATGQPPPGPTTRHQFRTAGLPVTGPMELAKFINEYTPGAETVAHTHPGLVVGTMIEGENTCTAICGDRARTYRLGETLIERPGEVAVFKNTGTARARVMASIVLPKGAPLSTPQPGAPPPAVAPTALYLSRVDAIVPAGPYEVAHAVLDFAPGAQTPVHTHPGQTVVTVLEGEQTIRSEGAAEQVYRAGESFFEQANHVVQAVNMTSGQTTVLVTYLLPQGAPLSVPVQAMPGLPATGQGAMAGRAALQAALVMLAGLALGGAAATLARRRA